MGYSHELYAYASSMDTIDLENITVRATRAQKKDPLTYLTIASAVIREIHIGQDPSVLLERLSPSILSYSDAGADIGNYVQFRMRGMDQTRINITLNGLPLNDMIDQGVFFSNFSDFSNGLGSIQIQRGAGTSSNGVASYAGSVNFLSPPIFKADPGAEIEILTGSFGTLRTTGKINTGVMPNDFAMFTRISKTKSSGYKIHSGSDSYSFFFSGGYLGDHEVIKLTAFAGKTQNDQSYLPVLLSDISLDPRTNYNSPNDTDDFEQELIQLQYGKAFNSRLSTSTSLYYGGARGVFPFGLDNTTQLVFGLSNAHYGFNTNWTYLSPRWEFNGGLHTYTFRRQNKNYTAPNISNPDYIDHTQKDEVSIFGKVNYDLGNVNLYVDGQMRHVNLNFKTEQILSFGGTVPSGGIDQSRDWTFINARIGLNMDLTEQSTAYISFGRTGREPTRTDILQGDGSSINEFNFFSILDDQIVRREIVNDLEIGWRHTSRTLDIAVNYFFMKFKDEISQVGALADRSYVPLRQNVPSSNRTGIEIQSSYAAFQNLSFGLNASLLNTNVDEFEDTQGVFNNINHIFSPKIIFSPGLKYDIGQAISLDLTARYVSSSFMELSNDVDFTLPAYFLLNTRIDIDLAEKLGLSLMVNNVFDQLYFNDGAPVDINFDGQVEGPGYRIQPRRNYYVMLRWKL